MKTKEETREEVKNAMLEWMMKNPDEKGINFVTTRECLELLLPYYEVDEEYLKGTKNLANSLKTAEVIKVKGD